jgi:pimeloyl-ACP methyl ester carboxylesterase
MKAAADNVQALVVANSAHFVAEEAPDQLLAALVPFLTS